MTTEDNLQTEIDVNPGEVALRGLVADLLGETGDLREMGYRAMSRLGRRPCLRADQPGYHFGGGLTTYPMREAHNDERLNRLASKLDHSQLAEAINRRSLTITLPADPVHSLPRAWFNACWAEWWKNDEEQLPWVMLKTRRELDDFVAKAFLNTPEPFRDHVLNCPLPVEFPFRFDCPACKGRGCILEHVMVPNARVFISDDPPKTCDRLFRMKETACFRCNGRGKFREDYGNPE